MTSSTPTTFIFLFKWLVTLNIWQMTCDWWHVWGGEPSLKIPAFLLWGFGSYRWHGTPDMWQETHDTWHDVSSRPGKDSTKILSRIYRVDGHPCAMKIRTFSPRPAHGRGVAGSQRDRLNREIMKFLSSCGCWGCCQPNQTTDRRFVSEKDS